ncbi:MAG: hypothetical protein RIK87_28990 [Fuerstiella sp.]
MQISVANPASRLSDVFRGAVGSRLQTALARFSNRITQVEATLSDENGPRGGVDKQCRVSVVMPGIGTISTSARHENLMAAVGQAARRARRIVITKLKRPSSVRAKRRSRNDSSVTPEVVITED